MSQELYKLLPFLKPVSGSADTTADQKTQALQRKSAEQIRQGGGLTGQTKTKELYKLFPFLQTAASKPQSSSSGNITRVGGKTYRMDNQADVKDLNAVLAADKASRPGQQFADLRGGGGMTTQTPPVGPVGPPSPIADPRNADYLTARGKLTEDSTAEDIKKVEDIGMTAWQKQIIS